MQFFYIEIGLTGGAVDTGLEFSCFIGATVDCQAMTCHFPLRLRNVPVLRLLLTPVVPSARVVLIIRRNATTAVLPYW